MEAYEQQRFWQACGLLPKALRTAALSLPPPEQALVEELRLRTGLPLTLTMPEGERTVAGTEVTPGDLEQVLNTVTEYSRYTASESLRQGYLTAEGGFRVGVCGSVVLEGGAVAAIKELSSLNIRIPRERPGISLPILPLICREGTREVVSTLILGAPGGGKTTFLRDMVRSLSDRRGVRVALVDERGEIAAMHRCRPQLQVGAHTDVMDACPKAIAIPALLRAMNPEVIAVDEVAVAEDVAAMERSAHAGTALLATVHGSSVAELRRKRLFAALLDTGVFSQAVCIRREGRRRLYEVERLC